MPEDIVGDEIGNPQVTEITTKPSFKNRLLSRFRKNELSASSTQQDHVLDEKMKDSVRRSLQEESLKIEAGQHDENDDATSFDEPSIIEAKSDEKQLPLDRRAEAVKKRIDGRVDDLISVIYLNKSGVGKASESLSAKELSLEFSKIKKDKEVVEGKNLREYIERNINLEASINEYVSSLPEEEFLIDKSYFEYDLEIADLDAKLSMLGKNKGLKKIFTSRQLTNLKKHKEELSKKRDKALEKAQNNYLKNNARDLADMRWRAINNEISNVVVTNVTDVEEYVLELENNQEVTGTPYNKTSFSNIY